MYDKKKAILITGCSSGIGRALTELCLLKDRFVVASARKINSIRDFTNKQNCLALMLDVCNPVSIRKAFDRLRKEKIDVEVLVNNAGYGLYGPLEDLSKEDLKNQFETNLFGLMEVTRMVIPGMRRRNSGRIINISSVSGRISFPFMGAYCASKFALEAFTSALRGELKAWKIKVISINPGPVKTKFSRKSRGDGLSLLPENSMYKNQYVKVLKKIGQGKPQDTQGSLDSKDAAKVIYKACTSKNPKNRYIITSFSFWMQFLAWLLPESFFEKLVWKGLGIST
jgi:short-subunit dehydrogenase